MFARNRCQHKDGAGGILMPGPSTNLQGSVSFSSMEDVEHLETSLKQRKNVSTFVSRVSINMLNLET